MDIDNDGAGIGQVFQQLAVQMANVLSALNEQGILQIVQVFDGNLMNFRDWIKQIEKYNTLTNLREAQNKIGCFSGK